MEWATTEVVFLGIMIDGKNKVLCIPEEKCLKGLNMIRKFCDRKKATVKELQSLAGTSNFLKKAIVPGRAFTRRMYAKFSNIINFKQAVAQDNKIKSYHHIILDQEFRFDCLMWEIFLQKNNKRFARPIIDFSETLIATKTKFETDASLAFDKGSGCYFNGLWTFAQWPKGFIQTCKPSIEFAELYALCLGVLTWSNLLTNTRVIVFVDNESVMHMINNMTSGCKNCMYLVRLITLDNLRKHKRIFAKHIKSEANILADSLSHLNFGTFWKHMPRHTKKLPTPIPSCIWPVTNFWNRISFKN